MKEKGIKLQELRSSKGITQRELAEVSNVNLRTIQRIESGEVNPRSSTLKVLAKALGVSFNDMGRKAIGIKYNKYVGGWIGGIGSVTSLIPLVIIIVNSSRFEKFPPPTALGILFPLTYIFFVLFFIGTIHFGLEHKAKLLVWTSITNLALIPSLGTYLFINMIGEHQVFETVGKTIFSILFGINLILWGLGFFQSISFKQLEKLSGTFLIIAGLSICVPHYVLNITALAAFTLSITIISILMIRKSR